MRQLSEREYAHERLGDEFARAISEYDTARRVEVLVDEFLSGELAGKRTLDVGCGLGYFSQRLGQRGAVVTATDIGPNLLRRVRETVGCRCELVDALSLVEFFGRSSFDVVVSSECIEHTPSPQAALRQMARVLRPGGWLAVSTPNRLWRPVVGLATVTGLRPFGGLENFSSFRSLRCTLQDEGLEIVREKGLHLIPFQLRLNRLSRWCDEHLQSLRALMINLCVLAKRPA